ncbi:tol-pal system protein YbgF [Agarivorans sp. TSD2052]|uniref:tol-pal system protein YbgF n=1 Tax=Agarivorans sp. TSD2052 TaxID=2937286 RepID=UPI00200CF71F|nr:tol-pal system protein YbgF [Agarivorans sp. TSD2052]UPW20608.1 tol-pal system protein YbgF [Agarivorans sp. TSD2052]
MKFKMITATSVAVLLSANVLAAAPVEEAGTGSAVALSSSALSSSNLSIEQRIERLERMIQARNQVQLDMQNQVEELSDSMSTMVGQIEQNNYQIEQMIERQREIYQELDRRFAQVQTSATTTQATAVATPTAVGEDQAYDAAVALVMQDKNYDAAIPAFETFISDFPKSSYAPNAHYWLGQLQYTRGQRAEASQQFNTVVNDYPQSNKVAESLLKLGIIAQFQNNNEEAKNLFTRVVEEHPNSAAAGLAKNRLAQF